MTTEAAKTRTIAVIEKNESSVHIAREYAVITLDETQSRLMKQAIAEHEKNWARISKNHTDALEMLNNIALEQISTILDSRTNNDQSERAAEDFARDVKFITSSFAKGCNFEAFAPTRATPTQDNDIVTLVRGNK